MKNRRPSRGSTLILVILAVALVISVGLVLFQFQMMFVQRQKAQSAAEAAALEAATQLSRIVVDDLQWGFVSLSNHSASGKNTMAKDGESLPVVGVNEVLAAVRTEKLLANSLNSASLSELASEDYENATGTCQNLQGVLLESLKSNNKRQFTDFDGNKIMPYAAARKMFEQNFPDIARGKARLAEFTISCGWLSNGSTTMTPDPERKKANRPAYYSSFVNLPVGDNQFYFAGTSDRPVLVDSQRFRKADGKRFCSAVLVTAKIAYNQDLSANAHSSREPKPSHTLCVTATALPPAVPYQGAVGTFVIACPQGYLDKVDRLRRVIDLAEFNKVPIRHQLAEGGDFPVDSGSKLIDEPVQKQRTVSRSTAEALFSWLRTNLGRASLASILDVINSPFDRSSPSANSINLMVMYDFDRDGECRMTRYSNHGFRTQTLSDRQSLDVAFNVVPTNKGMLGVVIRNQVYNCNPTSGGKHAGQPLASELPVDYSRPSLSEHDELGLADKEGDKDCCTESRRFRTSYIRGGLAVCMELSATQVSITP
ncbi:MAG: hypothetical protein K2Z81_12940 [Cyanobacteria bacterium]|nr:hypothetical protein [Cyanobacteriota bacterium]